MKSLYCLIFKLKYIPTCSVLIFDVTDSPWTWMVLVVKAWKRITLELLQIFLDISTLALKALLVLKTGGDTYDDNDDCKHVDDDENNEDSEDDTCRRAFLVSPRMAATLSTLVRSGMFDASMFFSDVLLYLMLPMCSSAASTLWCITLKLSLWPSWPSWPPWGCPRSPGPTSRGPS